MISIELVSEPFARLRRSSLVKFHCCCGLPLHSHMNTAPGSTVNGQSDIPAIELAKRCTDGQRPPHKIWFSGKSAAGLLV